MGAEKVIAFRLDISGVSNEDNALAKLDLQIKNIKKDMAELEKSARKGIASNEQIRQLAAYNKALGDMQARQKDLTKVANTAKDSLTRMRAELIRLKADYANGSAELRSSLIPQISKLNNEVSKAEQAIGVHSRGVGNYKDAIMSAGKSLIGFTSLAALAVAAVGKLTEAFKQTEKGTKVFSQITEQFKTLFQGIVGGEGLKESFKNAILVGAKGGFAETMDKIRKGDREDLKVIAQYETDINLLRLKSVDAALSLNEQKKYLIEAEKKENELIAYRIADKQEELNAINEGLLRRKDDTVLLDRKAQLEAEIIQIRGDKNLRLASKLSALTEKEIAEAKKAAEEKLKIEAQFLENKDRITKYFKARWKDMVEKEAKPGFKKELQKLLGISEKDLGLQVNKDIQEKNIAGAKSIDEADIINTKETEDKKLAIKQAALQGAQMGADAAFASKKNRLQAEMEAELSNANLTESQKIAIKKKYAKEQQKLDIKQAIINGALAIGNAFATAKPFFPAAIIAAALATLQTGIQIATIKAQKYATGGKIKGGLQIHPDTSKDNTLIYAKQGETVLNQRQISLLGGSAAMRKIRVPGYASGGFIGTQSPEIPGVGFDYQQLARLMNSIEVKLDINKVRSAQREVEIVTESQRI